MLGATNAELMSLGTVLSESIEKLLQDNSSSTTQFELLMRGIEMMLRLTRQIDRFTQLRLIISEAHSALEGSTHSRRYVR